MLEFHCIKIFSSENETNSKSVRVQAIKTFKIEVYYYEQY